MKQDLRKMMKNAREEEARLPAGHEDRFAAKLAKEFGGEVKEAKTPWVQWAVAAVLIIGLGFFGWNAIDTSSIEGVEVVSVDEQVSIDSQVTMADISPELKQIENFYKTNINMQLASLEFSEENQELVDGYMQRLSDLDNAYKQLSAEMAEVGPTEATLTAQIDNLKFRLELLFKLKEKLKELKNQNNEQFNSIQA
jgi:flagellin-like hook-associated protein FlgL